MKKAIQWIKKNTKKVIAALVLTTIVLWVACNWNLKTRTPPIPVKEAAPEFELLDHVGKAISLDSLVQNGSAVIVFYRGYW
jgi:hypothetical protein